MLDNIRIVLINTFHPGNIGAAARAMKNMGLSQLYLVQPNDYPSEEAVSRAAGATDVLEQATIVDTLDDAIADCQLVIGTSARDRTFSLPKLDARACGKKAVSEARSAPVALVFGRETMGLHNEEIARCNYHVYIPANPEYPVLNVAQAIQLLCYEVWVASQENTYPDQQTPYPLTHEMDLFYVHLERVLRRIRFIIPAHEGKVLDKLRRYFNRSRPEKTELNILRGILASVEKNLPDDTSADSTPTSDNSSK